MSFKVEVGPPQISHPPGPNGSRGRSGRTDRAAERQGLYFLDTRVISRIHLGISLQTARWRTRGGEQKCFSFTALNRLVAKSPTAGILEVSRD
jgi:hypothetical protein